jgi:hypothetical protein
MAKNGGRDNHARGKLAYLAARLMAQDGVQDYATAKRKAARQAGFPDSKDLPSNQEVEEALRVYQALYQFDEQPRALRQLREIAVHSMQFFAQFSPYLTGSVLTGTAGVHSDINLQLFADSAKDFEIFLLNADIPYESGSRVYRLSDGPVPIPVFRIDWEGAVVTAAVFERDDQRGMQKYRGDGRPIERARLEEVKALLAVDANSSEAYSLNQPAASKAK